MMRLACSKPGCGGTIPAALAAAGGAACCPDCGSACVAVENVRVLEFSLVGGKWQHRSLPPPAPAAK
jgi:hypothetical protein